MSETVHVIHSEAVWLSLGVLCFGFGAKPNPLYDYVGRNDFEEEEGREVALLIIQRRSDQKYFATEYSDWEEDHEEKLSYFGAKFVEELRNYDPNFMVSFHEAVKVPDKLNQYGEPVFELVK